MEHQRLQYLIDKYLRSQCDEHELQELNNWFGSVDFGSKDLETWLRESNGEAELTNLLYQRFQAKLKQNTKVVSLRRFYQAISIAAGIFIVSAIAILVYHYKEADLIAQQTEQNPIVPGKDKAILTLANGSKIILDSRKKGVITSQSGIVVTKNAKGQLVYNISGSSSSNYKGPALYNTIETPRGGQYQVMLPDGTHVWLNAASSLKYPVHFSNRERKVELLGEAYFEVAHNKKLPFKVITGGQEIKVLGTHFNVNGYKDEPAINTTLLEGSVLVSNLSSKTSRLLIPGQQSSMANNSNQIDVKTVSTDEVISWKNGYFLFDNQDIHNIMKVISRWYDVDVVYYDNNINETFGGTFSRSAKLTDILSNLQTIGKVHFKIENRKVFVDR